MVLLRPLLLLLLLCSPAWAILIVAGTPPSGTIGVVTTMSGTSTSTGSGAASGTTGTLQISDGSGGFGAYAGSALCTNGIQLIAPTGAVTCATAPGGGAASGTIGTLQISDGAGGFGAYAGSTLCTNGVQQIDLTGAVTCATAVSLTPGNYACPELTLDVYGQITGVAEGPCVGGAGVTSLTGTANQIAVSASTGAVTLSIPSSPTLPGITTGTFSGSLTGTASTATTASALAANGANCSAGSFPMGVSATGAAENCTALPTTIAGTANQITASASTGAVTLSIPSSPTLPGTTTGTFSGALTGNASTATALAANGANCSAGQFPLGVSAAGAAESCTALPTTIAGTANQITASASTGAIVLSLPTNPTIPGLTASQCLKTDAGGTLTSISCSTILPSYLRADRPLTCTPNAEVINVPDALTPGAVLQICNDLGDDWVPAATPTTLPTLMTLPLRPPITNITASFTADMGAVFTLDTTAGDIVVTLPNAGDSTKPGWYRGILVAGTNGIILRATPPNLINGVTTDYPTILGVHAGFDVDRVGDNEWIVRESTPPAKASLNLPVSAVKFPTSNPAELNNAETNTRLLFDAATQECVIWQGHMPANYLGNLQVTTDYSMVSATTGGVSIDVSIMAVRTGVAADINTESYDTVNNCDDTAVPGTAGYLDSFTCQLTTIDSLVANDYFKLKFCRAPADSSDTATGDMEVVGVSVQYDWK